MMAEQKEMPNLPDKKKDWECLPLFGGGVVVVAENKFKQTLAQMPLFGGADWQEYKKGK